MECGDGVGVDVNWCRDWQHNKVPLWIIGHINVYLCSAPASYTHRMQTSGSENPINIYLANGMWQAVDREIGMVSECVVCTYPQFEHMCDDMNGRPIIRLYTQCELRGASERKRAIFIRNEIIFAAGEIGVIISFDPNRTIH